MRALICILLSGCAGVPLRTAATPATLDAAQLAGTWHVVASNFPMWTSGTKTRPTFHYGVLGEGRLSDTVRYLENGELGFIEGIDTQSAQTPTHFTWRGLGLLALFSSDWDVVVLDPSGDWAVIYFSSTLATPEGVDVITRAAVPSAQQLAAALSAISGDPVLSVKAAGLKLLVVP